MARTTKQAEPTAADECIIGFPGIDRLIVEKSRPLLALWKTDMTLAQFKILDAYLSRIDAHHPEKRLVKFEKGEIEALLEVDRIRKRELDKRLDGLYRGVVIEYPGSDDFDKIALFERASCHKTPEGLWEIELKCTQDAMKFIFNVEHLGYLRYRLRSIVALRSRYAYIMFLYIESNRFRLQWEEPLDELRGMLGAVEKTYESFRGFREKILDRARNELLEKTECRFDYTPIKRGRTVVALRFRVETLSIVDVAVDPDHDPNQYTLEGYLAGRDTPGDVVDYLASACCPPGSSVTEWTRADAQDIAATIATLPTEYLPGTSADATEHRQYLFIRQVYTAFLRAAERRRIKYRYEYFQTILKKAIQNTVDGKKRAQAASTASMLSPSAQRAHNFPERETDYEAAILAGIRAQAAQAAGGDTDADTHITEGIL